MELGWTETGAIWAIAVVLFVWANIMGRRPTDPFRPRLWSPVLVMGVAAVVAILMLAHMLSLATGVPFRGGGF